MRHLILFHHDPRHDDRAMAAIVTEARRHFENTDAAQEDTTLPLQRAIRHTLHRTKGIRPGIPRSSSKNAPSNSAIASRASTAGSGIPGLQPR